MALVVRLKEGPDAPERKLAFLTSPVRIGRNPLNDLLLNHEFVSQWHAVVRFDKREIVYADLGSTNGSALDGQRLQEREPTLVVDGRAILTIGTLQMSMVWEDNVATADINRNGGVQTSFNMNFDDYLETTLSRLPLSEQADNVSLPKSPVLLPEQPVAVPLSPVAVPPMPAVVPPNALIPVASPVVPEQIGKGLPDATEHMPSLDGPLMALHAVGSFHEEYKRGWDKFLAELRKQIESSPPAAREITAFFLANEFPEIRRQPEFALMLTEIGVDRVMVGCVDVEEWLRRLTHDDVSANKKSVGPAIAMERVGAILEVFADSFLELRKGYSQFENEMGLGVSYDEMPLDRAHTRESVIRFLMDPNADGTKHLNELRRSFANLALHQVAVLGGSRRGDTGAAGGSFAFFDLRKWAFYDRRDRTCHSWSPGFCDS